MWCQTAPAMFSKVFSYIIASFGSNSKRFFEVTQMHDAITNFSA